MELHNTGKHNSNTGKGGRMTKEQNQETREKDYTDQYDVVKAMIDVYQDKEDISKDLVLFTSDPQTREFITEQYKIAKKVRKMLPHEETATRAFKRMMAEITLIAVLNRNDKGNYMISKILQKETEQAREQIEEEQRQGLIDRMLKRQKTEENEE